MGRDHVLSGGSQAARAKVRIEDDDPMFATPAPKRGSHLTNQDIYAGNPKSALNPKDLMSKTGQRFASGRATGQYVNYINGVPVTELSPVLNPKRGKFHPNQKLPKIGKMKSADKSAAGVTSKQGKFGLRNSMASTKHADGGPLHRPARGHLEAPATKPNYQTKEERDWKRLRTQDEIVNDLEEQFGFTYEQNKAAMKKAKEDAEHRKKYATREDKDLIAKNIAYIKTLSESHKNIKVLSKSRLADRNSRNSLKDLHANDKQRVKRLMEREKSIHEMGKNYSPKRSKIRKTRISKKDLMEEPAGGSQINLLIPTVEQNSARNEG